MFLCIWSMVWYHSWFNLSATINKISTCSEVRSLNDPQSVSACSVWATLLRRGGKFVTCCSPGSSISSMWSWSETRSAWLTDWLTDWAWRGSGSLSWLYESRLNQPVSCYQLIRLRSTELRLAASDRRELCGSYPIELDLGRHEGRRRTL